MWNTEFSALLTRVCGFSRALQATALDLERQRATDSLKKGLGKRPEREELVESMFLSEANGCCYVQIFVLIDPTIFPGNILPDSKAAPALQGQQKELEKHMRADSLEQKIQQRPKPEELVKEGILGADEVPAE